MLTDQRVRASGEVPDFSRADVFERLAVRPGELPVSEDWLFDTVIVDEGQDFSEAWRDLALKHLKPGGRALWLEDPMQNLYVRPPVALPGWVVLRARGNYRSPRLVVRMLQGLLPEDAGIEAVGPLNDAGLEVLTYRDAAGLEEQVKEGIRLCLAAGYRKSDLALLTYRGREQSALFPHAGQVRTTCARLPAATTCWATRYSEGEVLDDKAVCKLFVGATRAMMKLVLVVSERSAAALLERLG